MWCCLLELSAVMGMFYSNIAQYGTRRPHVAIENL